MADPVAIWGAITGTTAVLMAGRRELIASRRRLRVDFGWTWFIDSETGELADYWVYVMVQNTGGREISVLHLGLGWPADLIEETRTAQIYTGHRVEFVFGEPYLHLGVDGPPVKVDVPAGPLMHLFDPWETPVQPMTFTGGGNEARLGEQTSFIQSSPIDEERLRRGLQRLKDEAEPPQEGRDGLSAVQGYVRGSEVDMGTIMSGAQADELG
jgi:hypothetical protein